MSGVLGVLWGGALAIGVLLVGRGVVAARSRPFDVRVYPYLRDLPATRTLAPARGEQAPSAARAVFGPLVGGLAAAVERVLGGARSIEQRLVRAGLPMSVADFRREQVLWGLLAFAATAVPAAVLATRAPGRAVGLLVLCAVAFAAGVMFRENWLTSQAARRERRILAEFPTLAELMALAVAAGESPLAALERVVARARGEMSQELRRVLADVRTGTPLAAAFDALGARSGLAPVARFADGIAIAIERGTPLADVLHAQAADVREASRRDLIESGARSEVLMMVPVVFLVLPIVIVFAFYPGLIGLRMVV